MELIDFVNLYLTDKDDALEALLTWLLNGIMETELKQKVGAERYERTASRKYLRNGYKPRSLKTRCGTLALSVPQIREEPFKTSVFERYSRVENSILCAVSESYISGVSTRNIREIFSNFGIDNISKSSVSRIATELDEKVEEFLKRPIEQKIPFLYLDATYLKIRENGRYVSKALLIATGVREDGYREILYAKFADAESKDSYTELFDELKERGLKDVKLITSDGHKGIRAAVAESMLGSAWQMCMVHFVRAVKKNMPKGEKNDLSRRLKENYENPEGLQKIADDLRTRGRNKSANTIESFLPDLMNYTSFPKKLWRKLRTSNMVENLNDCIKRRTNKIGAFPTEESALRVAVSILIPIDEQWQTGRRYMDLSELYAADTN